MIYCADFENAVPPEHMSTKEIAEFETFVWGAGLCPAFYTSEDEMKVFSNIEQFFDEIVVITNYDKEPVIYFHNLAYDGLLICDYLLRHGYECFEGRRSPRAGQFKCLISSEGAWYSLKLRLRDSNATVEFRDSLKIFPFSLEVLGKQLKTPHQKLVGEIDYRKDRKPGYRMTWTEREYLVNDIFVMCDAFQAMQEFQVVDSLTIGSACMKRYKDLMGKRFYSYFPELDKEVDEFIRKSYRGGWCFCYKPREIFTTQEHYEKLSKIKGRKVTIMDQGYVYDVNSLYPFVMHSDAKEPHVYPIGEPHYFEGESGFNECLDKCYIVRVGGYFKLKPHHLPCLQVKGSRYSEHEYLQECEYMEFTLTKPDLELVLEQYDTNCTSHIIDGYWFASADGIFDEYIDYWYKIKANAQNKAVRLFAKLMLNNLYGKFGMNDDGDYRIPKLNGKNLLELELVEADPKKPGYIPVGAFVTAYARCKTVRAAQLNEPIFCYSDTDSIHLTGPAEGIEVDGSKLGAWDNESRFSIASFIRQKTYCEYGVEEPKGGWAETYEPFSWTLKACGAPAECKERMLHEVSKNIDGTWIHEPLNIDEETGAILNEKRSPESLIKFFDIGLEEEGKMLRKRVKGGGVLVEGYFTMH